MTLAPQAPATLTGAALDPATKTLVRLAATIAVCGEPAMRAAFASAFGTVDETWVEEVILQSYLFAGFPRALNAAREWRRISGRAAPREDEGADFARVEDWRDRGEATCAAVYGVFYAGLRRNIRELHPALDTWMIVEGYGKVLGREGLDLKRRELCVVAVCAAARQDRQLHSHLHGALNVGATPDEVRAALAAVEDLTGPEDAGRYRQLLARVLGK